VTTPLRLLAVTWKSQDRARRVTFAAAAMVVVQLAFRAWVLFPSWFLYDDYSFLHDARRTSLSLSFMFRPYEGHLMPGGRLVTWIVAQSGQLNWTLAATITLVLQACASLAAWWMLRTLFGSRPAILVPLAVYLTSALTLPGFTWWIASLTSLPAQVSFFVAVGAWVAYMRTRRWLPLLAAALAVALSLAFDVKAVLVLPVLAYVAIAYFATGSIFRRVWRAFWTYRLGWLVLIVIGAAYSSYYVLEVPKITRDAPTTSLAELVSLLFGRSLVPGLLGGPWRWSDPSPPTAFSGTPVFLVSVCWAVAALVVVYLALRRTRTLRAWLLLAFYLVIVAGLLASARSEYGQVAGRDYRFLTGTACVAVLCLALASIQLIGAVESSEPRERPLVSPLPRWWPVVLASVVSISGLANSAAYAHIWHTENASDAYMHRLRNDLRAAGRADLASSSTPEAVITRLLYPRNNTELLAPLVSQRVHFPSASRRLLVVGPTGELHRAVIKLGVQSEEGPAAGCGWHVTSAGLEIPLKGRAFDSTWWMRIGYLASDPSTLTITTGTGDRRVEIPSGLGNLFLRVKGTFDSVRIDGLEPGQTLCVDRIDVGQPVAGERL
jgi:hypothetical protein